MTTEGGNNVFEAVAALLPAEQREHFYRRMNRLMQLKQMDSDDDMLQIAEAMGFLALLIRQAPAELATERQKIETALQDTRRALNEGQSIMLDHKRQLESLLADLAGAIAEHVDAAAIASPLAETIRQTILSCSLPQVADDLSAHANRLADVTARFSEQIEQFSVRDKSPIDRVNRALTLMQHQLMNACEHVHLLTNMLTEEVRAALVIFTAGAIAVGFFLGILFQQWCGAPTHAQVPTTEALGQPPDSPASSVTKMPRSIHSGQTHD